MRVTEGHNFDFDNLSSDLAEVFLVGKTKFTFIFYKDLRNEVIH